MHATFDMSLPRGYSMIEVLKFHGRDKLHFSEQVRQSGFRKGILLTNIPAVIDIEFDRQLTNARCSVFADGDLTSAMQSQAKDICQSILGLKIDPEEFSAFIAADPLVGPLVARQPNLRIVQSASIFEALTWAVMGQQINVSFAVSLRRTFVQQAGRQHSSGLWCYPSPEDVARCDIAQLTTRQFSKSKAETILRLSRLIADNELDLVLSETNPIEKIDKSLLSVKGIGPWTVNYSFLRGYAYADCSLHGDVAVRAAIHKLIGGESKPSIAAAEEFLKPYSPHRTMACAHLWTSLSKQNS